MHKVVGYSIVIIQHYFLTSLPRVKFYMKKYQGSISIAKSKMLHEYSKRKMLLYSTLLVTYFWKKE
jgi:hypothetical protein